jgi:hypothetical protein
MVNQEKEEVQQQSPDQPTKDLPDQPNMGEMSQSLENKSSGQANTRSSLQNQSGNTANQGFKETQTLVLIFENLKGSKHNLLSTHH